MTTHRVPVCCLALTLAVLSVSSVIADSRADAGERIRLSKPQREHCWRVLRAGLRSEKVWPSIHAAEALTLAGQTAEVRRFLEPKRKTESDDQKRCGIARELVRAGDVHQDAIMLKILAGKNDHGHVHAAESLFKVGRIGDGRWMRKRFAETKNPRLKIMAAAALGKCGNPHVMTFLRKSVAHSDIGLSQIAAWVLARIGDKTDIPRLRRNRKRAKHDLTRVYFDNALALLGDAASRKKVLQNLAHKDASVRTYSAVFAGEAGITSASQRLLKLLDDTQLDVRIRAAQALLVLSQDSKIPRRVISRNVFPATKANPRYSEGS
ncbi:MAG: HEAT repeat domain-containing protein, partial [Planctomycetes bacterium]|nr:HEAT repeat domain-containing protein [Planctomycetota bacterium]